MRPVSLVSYNIHKGMSPLNRLVKLKGMANALADVAPDILCLQEVQGQNLKRVLAYNEYPTQSQHEWFGEFLSLDKSYGKNASYKHGHHGNATLSRFVLDPKHNVNITVSRLEKRGVLHCEILPDGWHKPIVVLNAHLNLLEKDRQKQYQSIMAYIGSNIDKDKPLILAGDFNDWQKKSGDILQNLGLTEVFMAKHGKYLPTFPAKMPFLSLDRIYVRHLCVLDAMVYQGFPWSSLSDHLPIKALLAPCDDH